MGARALSLLHGKSCSRIPSRMHELQTFNLDGRASVFKSHNNPRATGRQVDGKAVLLMTFVESFFGVFITLYIRPANIITLADGVFALCVSAVP